MATRSEDPTDAATESVKKSVKVQEVNPPCVMAQAPLIEFFDHTKSKFSRWIERLEGAFEIYRISGNDAKAYFLHFVGADTYETLCDLLSPKTVKEVSYEDLKLLLVGHFDPKPLEIAEYYKFHHEKQNEFETVREYLTRLRKMATTCNFGAFLSTALRNQFTCGLRDVRAREKLLETKDLTIDKALHIAEGCEARSKNELKEEVYAVKVKSQRSNTDVVCYRCSGAHYANKCPFKNVHCDNCKKKGHLKKACRAKSQAVNSTEENRSTEVNNVEPVYRVNMFTSTKDKILVNAKLNNQLIQMELDSGSAVSVMGEREFYRIFPRVILKETNVKLCSYTDNFLNVIGVAEVGVEVCGQRVEHLKLYVVSGINKLPLFGRQWLRAFTPDLMQKILEVNYCADHSSSVNTVYVEDILKKYAEVFNDSEVGEIKGEPVSLYLKENSKPVFCRARTVPFALKEKIEDEIYRLVKLGVLIKVDYSEYATPIVPVLKPDGGVRLCGDFKVSINPQLIVDEHHLPTIEELFADLAGGQKFSKIDLKCAYLQWKVRKEDQKYLTLNTHLGLYQSTRLMFGLSCAPAKWQRKIENILKGIPGVSVFIDDIKITAPNDKIHLDRLDLVFSRLSEYGLKVNLKKSVFLKEEIEYCGYKIDRYGIHKLKSKIEAIQNAPIPQNVNELQSFLGLINYYGRFIKNLSSTLEPLHNLLRKETGWEWTKQCTIAFNKLKEQMQSEDCLVHYSPELPLILATDASPIGVSAVISHIMPDGNERPIQMASHTLNKCQRKWSQIDKEAYAIVFGVKRFFQFLYGRKFILYTDNKPLLHILSPNKALPYAIYLQGFNYEIKYKSSKQNANADALSRLPIVEEDKYLIEESDIIEIQQIESLPLTVSEVANATLLDKELTYLLEGLRKGKKLTSSERLGIDQNEFSIQSGCIMRGIRVVIPKFHRKKVLEDLHTCHFGRNKMLMLARSYCWWPNIDLDIKNMVENCRMCCETKSNPKEVQKHHWERPAQPFERIHIDFAGKFLDTYFLLIIDSYSKWPEIYILNKIDTESTIQSLDSFFARFGYPKTLVSDNGAQFTNPKFVAFLRNLNIEHKKSAPYCPSTNGQAERFVQTMKNKLKALGATNKNVGEMLNKFLGQYRITPHVITKKSPAELIFSYRVRTKLSMLVPKENVIIKPKKFNHTDVRNFEEGDRVICRNYTGIQNWKFGKVHKRLGKLHYEILLDSGLKWRRHVNQMRKVGNNIPKTMSRYNSLDSLSDTECQPSMNTSNTRLSDAPPPSPQVPDEMPLEVSSELRLNNENNVIPNDQQMDSTEREFVVQRKSSRVRKKVERLDL